GNKPVTIDNIKLQSSAEGARYLVLKLRLKAGLIKNLELQPKFVLQESFKKNGKTERSITYKADFRYIDENGNTVIEDVKGCRTEVFNIKLKLFERRYPDLTLTLILVKRKKRKK
ncbi:hypothetical protein LCGC14_2377980, partial [marine sediment metagenome]